MTKTTTYPILSLKFWPAYWIHMRPYLLFISGVAGWTGMSVSGVEHSTIFYILLFLTLFFGYGFAQALTDCFQVDTDKISAPYRPLSQEIVTPKDVGIVSMAGLVSIAIILVWCNWYNILFAVLSIFGLATYSYFKRNHWYIGPFYNAWITALLPVMGYMSMDPSLDFNALLKTEVLVLVGLTFISYTNFVLIGYLKDISADRETGYKTFPVVFGWEASVWIGDIVLLLSLLSCIYLVHLSFWGMVFFVGATVIAIAGQLYAHLTADKTEGNAHFPIAATVRSFILWHLAVLLSFQPEWLIMAVIFYALFEITLYVRPSQSQI